MVSLQCGPDGNWCVHDTVPSADTLLRMVEPSANKHVATPIDECVPTKMSPWASVADVVPKALFLPGTTTTGRRRPLALTNSTRLPPTAATPSGVGKSLLTKI